MNAAAAAWPARSVLDRVSTALGCATSLSPSHGEQVVQDPAKVKRLLLETAEYLDPAVSQTLAAMNEGAPPHVDIVYRVRPPETSSPWLKAEFIVRNIVPF